jgi:hypothetical protein
MTLINIASVFISAEEGSKERRQGVFIAMLFFVLLYNQNSALLLYWTFNQLFSLIRYLTVYPLPKIKLPSFLNFSFAWQFFLVLAIHSILILFARQRMYEAYLIFAVLIGLLIYKFVKKIPIYFSVPCREIIILNISAMAFPAVLIFKVNAVYFDLTDTVIYGAALLLFSVATSFVLSPKFSVSFILALMFLPMVREITHYTTEIRTAFLALFIAILILVGQVIKQRGAITAFSITASVYLMLFVGNVNIGSKQLGEKVEIPKELLELELKDSASIYLFMHDAFPHKDYAEYFNMPSYDSLMAFFEQHGFKIYDVYTMGDGTLESMAGVFDINIDSLAKINGITTSCNKHNINSFKDIDPTAVVRGYDAQGDSFREKLAGNNITNFLLQSKGYSTWNYNPYDRYIGSGDHFYDFVAHDEAQGMYLLEPKNLIFKALLRAQLNSNMISASRQFLTKMAEFAQSNSENSKIFAWGMGCPMHATFGAMGTTEKELQKFLPLYIKCMAAMKEEIETATQNPNAIIIFMSDHGVYLMDDGMKFVKNYDFNKVDYMKFRDIFGAFMAVRFPNKERAEKYDSEFYVSQDLFPIVFAYLFDSEIPLSLKIQSTELRLGHHKFDKGVFYKNFYSKNAD